jgi:hypothetical protein
MKTKIAIVDTLSFVLGVVMFFVAFADLLLFVKTSDIDKLVIMFLALSLGLRNMQDSTVRINLISDLKAPKEENNNGK